MVVFLSVIWNRVVIKAVPVYCKWLFYETRPKFSESSDWPGLSIHREEQQNSKHGVKAGITEARTPPPLDANPNPRMLATENVFQKL